MALELTVIEKTELEELETVIKQDMGAFYRVGCALAKIRDSRLYRQTHDTFEEYCKDRLDMSLNYSERLMISAKVFENIKSLPMGRVPANERQARPLTKLATAEAQREAWETVVETAPEGKITARHVSKVVFQIRAEFIENEVMKKAAKAKFIDKDEIVSLQFEEAFQHLFREIKNAKALRWRTTSKEAALQYVNILLDVINIT
ncbi:MAG TPA: hypothetical protein VMW10_00420 [Alphaproteobacteria bacterium]|nr:hypothetical protein [Alphaproteobacteria bacterium]